MKIVRLTAENVKRLKAVEITPDGNVQVITGRNAQGKTSVLDAIWLALGGGAASRETTRPIRDGEDKASVTLDLGDLTVTRTWVGDKTALTVKNADGAKYGSPQGVLDALVGRLSFDPLEFTRLSAREQVAALLDLVDLDVDLAALAADRASAYEERAEIGRQGKAIGAVIVDESLPAEETSATEIISKIRAAQEAHRADAEARGFLATAEARVVELRSELATWEATVASRRSVVDQLPDELPDVDHWEGRLATVEETNAAVRANNAARERAARQADLRDQYDALTARIEQIDRTKASALAKATFPVPGLGFDDSCVTFQGVPFSQASAAEQIRVSLAMAMSLNPKLRVIRILDGSLLDSDNLALIGEMANEQDYQVWIERVGDESSVGVVIEDGAVA